MCGIAGCIARQNGLFPDVIITGMTDIIRHRGPDDEGFILLNNDNSITIAGGKDTPREVWNTNTGYCPTVDAGTLHNCHAKLALGHRRLSIIDLSPSGHQPMSYGEGRYWIVYNGEVYNYQELRSELENKGYIFTTRSDTETILAAYAEWGDQCLERFVGMWAFAIFDRRSNEIFLSRDRYGIKPLYYTFSTDGGFFFGSEVKQFTVLGDWNPRLNPQRAYDQLVYSFTDHTDETMFAGVYQLPPGTSFRASVDNITPDQRGRIQYKKWYSIRRDPFSGSFQESANTFRALFERAVKEHLNADVLVGTALSGGLDSSSIVCEVNRLLRNAGATEYQKTFSSCSTDERYSERKWMDLVINHTLIDASFVYPDLKDAIDLTPRLIWHHDEPYQSQSAFLAYNVFRLASEKGVKVLLNGQGADEYLGGYGQFTPARYATMMKKFRFVSLIEDMKQHCRLNGASCPGTFLSTINHLLPTVIKRPVTRLISSSDNVKKLISINRINPAPVHPFDTIPVKYNTVPDISEHLTFYSTLPKYLRWEDRNSMAHSVEARVPFLDHRLVEFVYNLPDMYLEKDGVSKRVMREAMAGLLPEQIRNRRDKMGFTTPEERWVKQENPDLFRKKIEESVEITDGLIKPEALTYFDNVVRGKLPFDYAYWRLILFGVWIDKFNVKI